MPSGEASEAAVPWNDALPTAPMPVLDWEALGSADPAVHKAELKKLEEIARTVGFFYLKNVPIEKSRLNRQFELAKQLFELPEEEKEPLNMGIKGEFGGHPILQSVVPSIWTGSDGPLANFSGRPPERHPQRATSASDRWFWDRTDERTSTKAIRFESLSTVTAVINQRCSMPTPGRSSRFNETATAH